METFWPRQGHRSRYCCRRFSSPQANRTWCKRVLGLSNAPSHETTFCRGPLSVRTDSTRAKYARRFSAMVLNCLRIYKARQANKPKSKCAIANACHGKSVAAHLGQLGRFVPNEFECIGFDKILKSLFNELGSYTLARY